MTTPSPISAALAHGGQVADDAAVAQHRSRRQHRAGRDAAALAQQQRRQRLASGGRAGRQHRLLAEHGAVADRAAVADQGALVHRDVGPEPDVAPDLGALAEHQVGRRVGRPHHARAASSTCVTPPCSSERCIACSTSTTARPSSGPARSTWPVRTASRKARHSIRSGSSREISGMLMSPVCVLTPPVGVHDRPLVVDRDLAVGLHVVEHGHLGGADHGHLAHLVRVEPRQVQVADLAGVELDVAEHDVLDATAARTPRRAPTPRPAGRRAGAAPPRCRARRGSTARSRPRG